MNGSRRFYPGRRRKAGGERLPKEVFHDRNLPSVASFTGRTRDPKTIEDVLQRNAYMVVLDLNEKVEAAFDGSGKGTEEFVLIKCEKVDFSPASFLRYFHKMGRFSERQLKFIFDVHRYFKICEIASGRFTEAGHREELIRLYHDIAELFEGYVRGKNSGGRLAVLRRRETELREGELVTGLYLGGRLNEFLDRLKVRPEDEDRRKGLLSRLHGLLKEFAGIMSETIIEDRATDRKGKSGEGQE